VPLLLETAFSASSIEKLDAGTAVKGFLHLAGRTTDEAVLQSIVDRLLPLLHLVSPSKHSIFFKLFTEPTGCRMQMPSVLADATGSLLTVDVDDSVRYVAQLIWLYIRPVGYDLQHVCELIDYDDPLLPIAAIKSLSVEELSSDRVVDALLARVADWESDVARAAALALSEISNLEQVQNISRRVSDLLDDEPNNKAALKVLWESLAWQHQVGASKIPF
jgi:hypothetical protein